MTDDFWQDRFHYCAWRPVSSPPARASFDDALYVRELAYALYKEGAFRDCVRTWRQKTSRERLIAPPGPSPAR